MSVVWQPDLLWTQQVGVCRGIVVGSAAVHEGSGCQHLQTKAARCSSVRNPALPWPRKCVGGGGGSVDVRRQEEEHLWQQFFLDPTMWWDNRLDKKSSRSPDFRRKGSGEVLWLNNMFKPAWVDEQLGSWDMRMGHGSSPSESSSRGGSESGRSAELEMGFRCSSERSPEGGSWVDGDGLYNHGRRKEQEQEQEHLWQQFFLDPAMWWDNRRDKKSSGRPDFRRKGSGEVLWLNNSFKPAWVDEQLVSLDAQMGRGASSSQSSSVGKPQLEIVSALCQQGKLGEAVGVLESLALADSAIPQYLFYTVLKLCTKKKDLAVGRRVHELVVKLGFESDAYLGNHVLRMYASGGSLQEAMDVFTRVRKPNAFIWVSIISAYAKHGRPKEAIQLYHEMCRAGVKADAHVFVAALQACALASDLESGRKVHSDVLDSGIPTNLFVGNCLVDMYAKCGNLKDARKVFDSLNTKDLVTWNALLAGYAKCGELEEARQVLDSMETRDVVTWTTLIAAYAQHGLGQEALVLYGQMEEGGLILADHVALACLLKACGGTGALQKGRQLHSQIVERGLLDDLLLGTCLVDMYAKCGELGDARQVFDRMATKDVVTWNALMSGYGTCDEGRKALTCFEEMLAAGIQPDDATFTCLLVACSHEGLVHEGRKHFYSMAEKHGIIPTVEHYTCMVDLLGRAGHLQEAEKLLSCEGQSDVVGLVSLLNSCKSHGDIERAKWCFESIVRLDPTQAPAYVLMANAYADAGRWTDVDRIETQRREAGATKKAALATIEVNREVHRFLVGERREDIALKVERMNARVKQEGGHLPHTKLVLKPVCEKEKEDVLCGHAEKLALAFGLLNTPSGTPLVVTKNLRMCSDCHTSTEIMSRLERRDIVVRDGYRVHRFEAGSCSCKGRP